MRAETPLKFVLIGHIDHGKSTLIGRLLYDTNSLPPDKVEEVRKASKDVGDSEIEFAFVMDHLREEREQGITIDIAYSFFRSKKREYVIIDAPGHVEFVKNMLTGASQAEAALLIVDAVEGVEEQTKRHANLISMLGIKQVIVVINKMDLVNFKEDLFSSLKNEIEDFLLSLNLKPSYYIPISALKGDNIVKESESMRWYKGPTILGALDSLKSDPLPVDKELIFPIQDVYKIRGKRIAVGRIETGSLSIGEEVEILPNGEKTFIKSIEKFEGEIEKAEAGESIGITTETPVFLERGFVLVRKGEEPLVGESLNANLIWFSKEPLKKEERLTIRLATQETKGSILKIRRRIDSSSLKILEENGSSLNNLEIGEVEIRTKKPIVFTKFNKVKEMGRFVLIRENDLVAGGIIN
ncbi:MAG: GTP-binding protein [candidate division WOR-3 bacterium]